MANGSDDGIGTDFEVENILRDGLPMIGFRIDGAASVRIVLELNEAETVGEMLIRAVRRAEDFAFNPPSDT